MQNAAMPSDGQQVVINTLAVPAKALANTPQIADAIEQGVTDSTAFYLIDGSLVAVLVFKAVYTLEVRRGSFVLIASTAVSRSTKLTRGSTRSCRLSRRLKNPRFQWRKG